MKEPCYCGAPDCKRCHPENFKVIECYHCGAKTLYGAYLEELNGWVYYNKVFLCEDCAKKYLEEIGVW